MTQEVHILVTCRKPELVDYSLLVFQTLRIGFPTAKIHVYINHSSHLDPETIHAIKAGLDSNTDSIDVHVIHAQWIASLIEREKSPFFILDTDVVFYGSMEEFDFSGSHLAGWRIPEFMDDFTGSLTKARLHTSLLYIDPKKCKWKLDDYNSMFNETQFNPHASFIDPVSVALNGETVFYDCCSMLYQAIGGTAFEPRHLDKYFHFFFGTCSDLVLPRIAGAARTMAQARAEVLESPGLGKGLWRTQQDYYESKSPAVHGKSVIAPIDPKDAEDAYRWNMELCKGNKSAMAFCDIWYNYCHGIDDLIDTVIDGRPAMSKEEMIGLFFKAACLYNHPFYMANQTLLFPVILDVTNTYSMSVDWEKSPKEHLRKMADVFRMAGNKMWSMVALITGGEAHMLHMSKAINERDWLGQHDNDGNPK